MIDVLASARSILVRIPNWLGDALMARPFLFALRRAAMGARIVATGPAPLLGLLEADRTWDESRAAPARRDGAPPDVAFVLPPSFSSAWEALRWRARERVGFASDGRTLLLTRATRRPDRGDRHLAREYLELLGGGAPPPAPPVLRVHEAAMREADGLRAERRVAPGPYAVLAPGATYGPAKRWPAERFGSVARVLADEGLAVLACGAAGEGEACEDVARASGGAAQSLAGRTSLPAQAALCAGAAVVVSNDSGMAHLAAAVGAPTVAIFGSTSSAWTAPLGPRRRILQRPPVCAPCFARSCRIGYRCLDAVSVAEVTEAARALLADAGGTRA